MHCWSWSAPRDIWNRFFFISKFWNLAIYKPHWFLMCPSENFHSKLLKLDVNLATLFFQRYLIFSTLHKSSGSCSLQFSAQIDSCRVCNCFRRGWKEEKNEPVRAISQWFAGRFFSPPVFESESESNRMAWFSMQSLGSGVLLLGAKIT